MSTMLERIHNFVLPPGVGWMVRESRICLFLGRLFAVLAVIMVAIWCMKKNVEEDKYLGGIDFSHDKVFNLHPLCMILSMLLCMGMSMTSFRDGWSFKVSKYLHLNFNLLAKIFMIVGLRSAYLYRDEPEGKNSSYHYQHFSTMHSWMGLITSFLLFQQDIIGGINFLYPKFCGVPRYITRGYREYHGVLGKVSFVMAGVAMVTGIVAKNEHQGCVSRVSTIDQNPFDGYDHLPRGCQLSTGLGLVIFLSIFFIIFALRHPMTVKPPSHTSDVLPPLSSPLLPPEHPPKHLSFDDRKSFM